MSGPFWTLLIHPENPPYMREVIPGSAVNVHVSMQTSEFWGPDLWQSSLGHTIHESKFDMVCTMGFDFNTLTDQQQGVVRGLMRKSAVVIRMDPA